MRRNQLLAGIMTAMAAAVTALTMECMSAAVEKEPIIKTVELTRPFAFLIYDRSKDEILFIGKVTSIS